MKKRNHRQAASDFSFFSVHIFWDYILPCSYDTTQGFVICLFLLWLPWSILCSNVEVRLLQHTLFHIFYKRLYRPDVDQNLYCYISIFAAALFPFYTLGNTRRAAHLEKLCRIVGKPDHLYFSYNHHDM